MLILLLKTGLALLLVAAFAVGLVVLYRIISSRENRAAGSGGPDPGRSDEAPCPSPGNMLPAGEDFYRFLVERVEDIVFSLDMELCFTYVNPSIKKLAGYEPRDLLGRPLCDVLTPDSADPAKELLRPETLSSDPAKIPALELQRKGGGEVRIEIRATVFRGKDDEPVGFAGTARDVSRQKETEEALKGAVHEVNQILEFLPDPTFVIDARGRVTAWNRAIADFTGIDAQDMIGRGDYEYAVPFYGDKRPLLADFVLEWDEEFVRNYISIKEYDDGLLVSESYHPNIKGGGVPVRHRPGFAGRTGDAHRGHRILPGHYQGQTGRKGPAGQRAEMGPDY